MSCGYNNITVTFSDGGIAARNHLHIADLASPADIAEALIGVVPLATLSTVHTWVGGTPVHICLTVLAGKSIRAVTCVVMDVVHAGGATGTRRRVTFIDARLTVATSVSVYKH